MSARLTNDLEQEAARCDGLAHGFGLSGDRRLRILALDAAQTARLAARRLTDLHAAIGEQQERDREC